MKQRTEAVIAVPKRRPKTIRGWCKWHRELLELCAYLEFKERSLKSALRALNKELKQYVRFVREPDLRNASRLALRSLNRVKAELDSQLRQTKESIRIAHDTNEFIIRVLLDTHGAEEYTSRVVSKQTRRSTNLLHGVRGWLTEVACADHFAKRGYAAFVTFGTAFDPAGVDVVAFPRPLRRLRLGQDARKT